MNFIDFVCDQQRSLKSRKYVDMLWCTIQNDHTVTSITPEDEEQYRSHIPIEFAKFLKKCVSKLRDLKISSLPAEWDKLDEKYLSTLMHFALEHQDVTMDVVLYAADLFVVINTIDVPHKRFFYKPTYLKVLQVLNEFNRSQELTSNIIMFLMDDFKTFLSKVTLPEDVIILTVSVIHDYTYCCNDAFENITAAVSYENLGYIAFVCLKLLSDMLAQKNDNEKNLYSILICLTSSLKSAATNNLNRTVILAHQKNVRLFIKQNFSSFNSKKYCLVSNMLKFVCLCSDYDEYEAVAQLIQQLPCETNQNLITFLQNAMFSTRMEFRKHLLHLVIPIFHNPPEYEANSKRLIRTEIFIHNVIVLFADKNEQIRENAVRIIIEFSDDSIGRRILRKIMANNNYTDLNRGSIQDMLYKMLDKTWSKKSININYIQLICNLLLMRKDLVSLRTLNVRSMTYS